MISENSVDFDHMPVVRDPRDFDVRSGNALERLIFNHRPFIGLLTIVISLFLGWHATKLVVNGNFDRLIPHNHPYIQNYFDHKDDLRPLGNAVRIVVENTSGDIFDKDYLEFLAKVNDKAFLIAGVDRPWVKSIWMPAVRWQGATEKGIQSAPVMVQGFNGSPDHLAQLRANIGRAGIVGSLVANDFRSSMIVLPLLDTYPDTGKRIDFGRFGRDVEQQIRSLETPKYKIHVIGFGKLVGDLIAGLETIKMFFGLSALIAALLVFFHTRCVRSTVLLVCASTLGVVWLLGLSHLLGFELDPYSILVPFLIFAIGLSHGAQKMNGVMQDVGRGTHKLVAARYTFRRLFLPGLTALLTNVLGFAVLMLIDIPVIQDMAWMASLGVGVLIFTKLVGIPVALSYIGVSPAAARRSLALEADGATSGTGMGRAWAWLLPFTRRGPAAVAIACAAVIGVFAYVVSLGLQIGDLDSGAPELRQDSRYNRDVAYVQGHYGLSSDQFVVMVQGPSAPDAKGAATQDPALSCDRNKFGMITVADQLEWTLQNTEGVQATASAAAAVRQQASGMNEGSPKWLGVARDRRQLDLAVQNLQNYQPGMVTADCSMVPVVSYLADHKAATLSRVLGAVEREANAIKDPQVQVLPAAGSAGIEAVTNIVVARAQHQVLLLVYGSVIVLCFVTFRSWRAVVVALIPLLITSAICEALMVWLGIGLKVATLPVIALGVGVGVDYALYLLSIQLALQRKGVPLEEAYRHALQFTGKIVALVGITMAAGVVTWAWSPIKFQADMGILLTFMFVWNMIGALVLIPALSHFMLRNVGPAALEKTGSSGPAPSTASSEPEEESTASTSHPLQGLTTSLSGLNLLSKGR
jgi:predicted RND superfamily exporter protein